MNNLEKVKRGFLVECTDDYVGLWSVIWDIKHVLKEENSENIRAISVALIREFLEPGLIEAGIPRITGEFEKWQLSPEETVQRIENEWGTLGREPNIGDIVWFTSTKIGDDYVRAKGWK
jgi:hypothetical protein